MAKKSVPEARVNPFVDETRFRQMFSNPLAKESKLEYKVPAFLVDKDAREKLMNNYDPECDLYKVLGLSSESSNSKEIEEAIDKFYEKVKAQVQVADPQVIKLVSIASSILMKEKDRRVYNEAKKEYYDLEKVRQVYQIAAEEMKKSMINPNHLESHELRDNTDMPIGLHTIFGKEFHVTYYPLSEVNSNIFISLPNTSENREKLQALSRVLQRDFGIHETADHPDVRRSVDSHYFRSKGNNEIGIIIKSGETESVLKQFEKLCESQNRGCASVLGNKLTEELKQGSYQAKPTSLVELRTNIERISKKYEVLPSPNRGLNGEIFPQINLYFNSKIDLKDGLDELSFYGVKHWSEKGSLVGGIDKKGIDNIDSQKGTDNWQIGKESSGRYFIILNNIQSGNLTGLVSYDANRVLNTLMRDSGSPVAKQHSLV